MALNSVVYRVTGSLPAPLIFGVSGALCLSLSLCASSPWVADSLFLSPSPTDSLVSSGQALFDPLCELREQSEWDVSDVRQRQGEVPKHDRGCDLQVPLGPLPSHRLAPLQEAPGQVQGNTGRGFRGVQRGGLIISFGGGGVLSYFLLMCK